MEAIVAAAAVLLGQLGPQVAGGGLLALLSSVAPALTTAGSIGSAIKLIAAIVPEVPGAITLVKNEVAVVKSLIASIKANPATTVEQMDECDTLDARCDAIFDAALDKAEAADAAAAAGGGTPSA